MIEKLECGQKWRVWTLSPERKELMELLGGFSCSDCGYDDYRALEIDHIFGNGQEMPLSKINIIRYYLDNPDIAYEELKVLCANCHKIKTLENQERTGRTKKSLEINV